MNLTDDIQCVERLEFFVRKIGYGFREFRRFHKSRKYPETIAKWFSAPHGSKNLKIRLSSRYRRSLDVHGSRTSSDVEMPTFLIKRVFCQQRVEDRVAIYVDQVEKIDLNLA